MFKYNHNHNFSLIIHFYLSVKENEPRTFECGRTVQASGIIDWDVC